MFFSVLKNDGKMHTILSSEMKNISRSSCAVVLDSQQTFQRWYWFFSVIFSLISPRRPWESIQLSSSSSWSLFINSPYRPLHHIILHIKNFIREVKKKLNFPSKPFCTDLNKINKTNSPEFRNEMDTWSVASYYLNFSKVILLISFYLLSYLTNLNREVDFWN